MCEQGKAKSIISTGGNSFDDATPLIVQLHQPSHGMNVTWCYSPLLCPTGMMATPSSHLIGVMSNAPLVALPPVALWMGQ